MTKWDEEFDLISIGSGAGGIVLASVHHDGGGVIACTGHVAARVLTTLGNLMLIHKASSTALLGGGCTATVEMILKFMERERMQG